MLTGRSLRKDLMEFPVHFLTAGIGGTFLTVLLTMVAGTALAAIGIHASAVSLIVNPFLWLGGLILGFSMNRSHRQRSPCFVGVLGVALLFMLMLWDISAKENSPYYSSRLGGHYWQYEYDHLLSPDDRNCGGEECLGKLLFAAPALSTVAYSIGALLALRYSAAKGAPGRPSKV
jgi:hypothetical protein